MRHPHASRRRAELVPLLAAALPASFLLIGCATSRTFPVSAPSPMLGRSMPDFRRVALDGTTVATARLRGRPLVIKFFAEYCEPCQRSLPEAEQLHRAHAEVAFLGVSEDESESAAVGVRSRFGLSFPIIHDRGQGIRGRFRVTTLPMTFVIDRQGLVRWVGDEREHDLERAIAAACR
jgi:cytochrome c biogenesis protein CcmG/thiol:disulfide interchange protein DsbE